MKNSTESSANFRSEWGMGFMIFKPLLMGICHVSLAEGNDYGPWSTIIHHCWLWVVHSAGFWIVSIVSEFSGLVPSGALALLCTHRWEQSGQAGDGKPEIYHLGMVWPIDMVILDDFWDGLLGHDRYSLWTMREFQELGTELPNHVMGIESLFGALNVAKIIVATL